MIYQKTGFRYPENKRYYQEFEYMFVLSKGVPKTFNLIKDRKNKTAGEIQEQTSVRDKSGRIITFDIDGGVMRKEIGVRGNIWKYSAEGFKRKEHPATFPLKLAADHIISWSNKGDVVLDPMAGSGTTLRACKILKRNFIGIDISEDYCKLIKSRL